MKEKNYLYSAPTLILLAIGFIALLGFAFLAIEGGRIYMERYQAQSAANTVASDLCSDEHGLTKSGNGFAIPDGFFNDGANAISVNHPPVSGIYAGNLDYVEVVVSRSVNSGIANLVHSDQVEVTGRADVFCDESNLMISSTILVQD
jgi:hypothetical protein